MRCLKSLAVMLCLALLSSAAHTADSKTTRQLVSKLTEDLQSMWRDYPTDKQKDTRDRALSDFQQVFQREISSAEVPPALKMQAVVQSFINNMEKSATLWRLEKMASTRTAYLQACVLAFKREFTKTDDYAESRTTQQLFETYMRWLEDARDSLRRTHSDAQTQTYQAINEVVGNMIPQATVPDGDALAQMDKNLREGRKRFPITNEALKNVNQNILTMVEQRAKDVQARAVKK